MDNNFNTAKDLGILGQGLPRVRGSINSKDRVDIYRYTIPAGLPFQVRSSYVVKGGGLSVSLYLRNPITNTIQPVGRQALAAGRYSLPNTTPGSPVDLVGYIRFDRPTRNRKVSYQVAVSLVS